MTSDARITALEEKLAFLERHVEELDQQVRELFDLAGAQRQSLKRLQDETQASFAALDRDAGDEPPPHWGGRHG